MEEKLKVRFAPAPTGFLHIGSARTALFNWLFAKRYNAQFTLRIEDTDIKRSQKEFLEEILDSLKWLGIDWDEIIYQSQRLDIYGRYARKLLDERKAYLEKGAIIFKYEFKNVKFEDLIRGCIEFNELPKDTEVLIKSDGRPTYNFACCIDDSLLGITHVIRGEDHISNTPKQLLIYDALGFRPPCFAHLPMILSSQGGKLSKRLGATSIREYKDMGYLAEAITNYLLLLGWSPGNNREIVTLDEAVKDFEIRNVNKTGATFSLEKLDWINSEYIKQLSLEEMVSFAQEYLKKINFLPQNTERDYLKKVVELFKNRIYKLSNLMDWAYFCFYNDFTYASGTEDILKRDLSNEVIILKERLFKINNFDKNSIEREFRDTAQSLNLKTSDLVHPTRIALTGRKVGPGLFETMEVLGRDKVLERLGRLVRYWKEECL